ncbi:MAG: YlxR family protein [Anaerolineae bacterium]|jgi:hypothetical protein|nr:YlxR family protein [Anaerolineae bacterium]
MSRRVVVRMCCICREKDNKRQLTRLVRTAGGVVVDPTGKLNGRGAYVCDKPECWQRAARSDTLSKALRTTLTDTDREYLRQVVL